MNLITTLGLASMILMVVFTRHAYANDSAEDGGQSRRSSIIEAWTNIAIGFSINFCANLLLLPLVGATITLLDNFFLGCIYTAISMVRQFAIRRYFNRRIQRFANSAAERFSK